MTEEWLADAYAGVDDYRAEAGTAFGDEVRREAGRQIGGQDGQGTKGSRAFHGGENTKGVFRRRAEQADAFARRVTEEGYFPRTIAGTDYWWKPSVLLTDAIQKTQDALQQLGCHTAVVHGGVFQNSNGITTEAIGAAVTLPDGTVVVNDQISNAHAGDYTAFHEVFHSRYLTEKTDAEQYLQTGVINLNITSSDAKKLAEIVTRQYFQQNPPLAAEDLGYFMEEFMAFVSGEIADPKLGLDLSSMFRDYNAVKAAWQEVMDAARAEARKQTASETAAGTTEEEVKYSVEQTGRSGVPETASGFRERSTRDGRKTGEIGEALYAYIPVARYETSKAAEEIRGELKKLGIESFYHNGLEVNENGLTITAGNIATTIGRRIIGIYKGAFAPAKNVAGHEAFHFWYWTQARKEYKSVLVSNFNFLSPEGIKYMNKIIDLYFDGVMPNKSDEIAKAYFNEELYASISGDLHEGTDIEKLRGALLDYDAVKAAWDELVRTASEEGTKDRLSIDREDSEAPSGLLRRLLSAGAERTSLPEFFYEALYRRQLELTPLRDGAGAPIPRSRDLQVLALLYETPGLTEAQQRQLSADFGVEKVLRHWNRTMVAERLRAMAAAYEDGARRTAGKREKRAELPSDRHLTGGEDGREDDYRGGWAGRAPTDAGGQLSGAGSDLRGASQKSGGTGEEGVCQDSYSADSEGIAIPEGLRDRLSDTKAVDERGAILPLYHFTPDMDFSHFEKTSDFGFHFGSHVQAAKRRTSLEKNGRIIRVYLNIKNPVIIPKDIMNWRPKMTALLLNLKGLIPDEEYEQVDAVCEPWDGGYDPPGSILLREALERAGYDGIAYKNGFEGEGLSWIAFRDDQIIRTDDGKGGPDTPSTNRQQKNRPAWRWSGDCCPRVRSGRDCRSFSTRRCTGVSWS